MTWEEIEEKYCPLEIDRGWFKIVEPLFNYIEQYNADKKSDENLTEEGEIGHKIQVFQCKEKFGTLRFYTNYAPEELDNLINEAERKSAVTCENCGEPGTLHHRNYWLKTLCKNCANKFGYE